MHGSPSARTRVLAILVALLAALAAAGGAGAAQRLAFVLIAHRDPAAKHPNAFAVEGHPRAPVHVGGSQPVDLLLTNPHPYALRISKLTVDVRVDAAHTRAGCVQGRDFRSVRMPPASYPIVLGPSRRARLTDLRVAVLPRIAMVDATFNQDACKGAQLKLVFGGRARRLPARRHR